MSAQIDEFFEGKRILARFDDYDVGMTIKTPQGEVVQLTDFVPCLVLEDGDIVVDERKAEEIEARVLAAYLNRVRDQDRQRGAAQAPRRVMHA